MGEGRTWGAGSGVCGRSPRTASLRVEIPPGVQRRFLAPFALGAFLVLATGLSDGGYYGETWTAVSLVLAAAAAFALVAGPPTSLSRSALAALTAAVCLAAWTAVSAAWAPAGADVTFEARRVVLYALALAAVVLTSSGRRGAALLGGVLGAVVVIGAVALGVRVWSGTPTDRLYGALLEEPVGYPNALGALLAIGVLLAVGLAGPLDRRSARARALFGLSAVLLLAVALTQSRGAVLSLAVGAGALLFLLPAASRRRAGWLLVVSACVAGAAWGLAEAVGADGIRLALVTLGAAAVAALLGDSSRGIAIGWRPLALAAATLTAVVVATAALSPTIGTSSYRVAYWDAALAEVTEHPLQGLGAGSFYLTWRAHRTVETEVRDAHSLYVETLSELGVVGLGLVAVLIGAPLLAAWRRRGEVLAATAGAGFVVFAVHAGLDWDWEMPVVVLPALGCAGLLLAAPSDLYSVDGSTKEEA